MANEPEAVAISYQGIPCQRGRWRASSGLTPGDGYVVMPPRRYKRAFDGDPWAPHDKESIRGGGAAAPGGAVKPLEGTLHIRGPLRFVHGSRVVELPSIYVSDEAGRGRRGELNAVPARRRAGSARNPSSSLTMISDSDIIMWRV